MQALQQTTLSPREREVLSLLAAGLEPKEIATSLAVSVRTVHHQMESARLRLGVSTTWAAVAKATDLGLIGTRA